MRMRTPRAVSRAISRMTTVVRVRELIRWILDSPTAFPGPHQSPQPRTSRGLLPLDTNRQALLIWEAACLQVKENLQNQSSVFIQKFGLFTFKGDLQANPEGRDMLRMKPVFVPDAHLQNVLKSQGPHIKPEVRVSLDTSLFQSGSSRTVFLNDVPVAAGCYLNRDVGVGAGVDGGG